MDVSVIHFLHQWQIYEDMKGLNVVMKLRTLNLDLVDIHINEFLKACERGGQLNLQGLSLYFKTRVEIGSIIADVGKGLPALKKLAVHVPGDFAHLTELFDHEIIVDLLKAFPQIEWLKICHLNFLLPAGAQSLSTIVRFHLLSFPPPPNLHYSINANVKNKGGNPH